MNNGPENVWIIVAAYNEARRLDETLRDLGRLYNNIIVVNDGSSDQTATIARSHRIWLLRHAINCGQGAALQTGLEFAMSKGAHILVTFDADGQHSATDIAALVAPVHSGQVDVTLGSRFLGQTVGLPLSRWVILKLGVLFTRLTSRIRVSDTHNGLRAFSRRAAECIHITQDRMAHASEILDQIRQHGLKFCEVPVTIHYSSVTLEKGQSSWNALKIVGQLLLGRLIK